MDWVDELEPFWKIDKIDISEWIINRGSSCLKGLYYSDIFIDVFMKRLTMPIPPDKPKEGLVPRAQRKVEEAIAYHEEGVSKDVAVYLLMRDL